MKNKWNMERTEAENFLFEDIYRADESKKDIVGVWFSGIKYTYADIEKSVD